MKLCVYWSHCFFLNAVYLVNSSQICLMYFPLCSAVSYKSVCQIKHGGTSVHELNSACDAGLRVCASSRTVDREKFVNRAHTCFVSEPLSASQWTLGQGVRSALFSSLVALWSLWYPLGSQENPIRNQYYSWEVKRMEGRAIPLQTSFSSTVFKSHTSLFCLWLPCCEEEKGHRVTGSGATQLSPASVWAAAAFQETCQVSPERGRVPWCGDCAVVLVC